MYCGGGIGRRNGKAVGVIRDVRPTSISNCRVQIPTHSIRSVPLGEWRNRLAQWSYKPEVGSLSLLSPIQGLDPLRGSDPEQSGLAWGQNPRGQLNKTGRVDSPTKIDLLSPFERLGQLKSQLNFFWAVGLRAYLLASRPYLSTLCSLHNFQIQSLCILYIDIFLYSGV